MSYADKVFIDMCKDILANGTTVESRAVWEDTNQHASTIKKFGVINRYDLSKTFPAMTLRPVNFKACVDEILWIYQMKSNNVNDLNSKIWDQWADSNGTIGLAYGYQVGNCYRTVHNTYANKDGSFTNEELYLDQTDYVLHELKHNPFSRRILTNLYNVSQTNMMHLDPCCYSCTFNVTLDSEGNKVLNCVLNQRSNDILVANNWNVVQYAVLQHLFAQVSDMKVGELVHVIADAHIYDRHISIVENLITKTQYEAPQIWINPEIKDFYDFTVDDIKLLNYNHNSQIKNIPVAV